MGRNETQRVVVPTIDTAKLGVANADRILKHCCKHGMQIAGGAVYDLEDLKSGSLLLYRLVSLAGEPRDLCFLAGSG